MDDFEIADYLDSDGSVAEDRHQPDASTRKKLNLDYSAGGGIAGCDLDFGEGNDEPEHLFQDVSEGFASLCPNTSI